MARSKEAEITELQDVIAVKDKRLVMKEAQLAQLASTLPEDVVQQAMTIGELKAALAEERKQAAVQAAQIEELKSALPEDASPLRPRCDYKDCGASGKPVDKKWRTFGCEMFSLTSCQILCDRHHGLLPINM